MTIPATELFSEPRKCNLVPAYLLSLVPLGVLCCMTSLTDYLDRYQLAPLVMQLSLLSMQTFNAIPLQGYPGEHPLSWQHFVKQHEIDPELVSGLLGRDAGTFLHGDSNRIQVLDDPAQPDPHETAVMDEAPYIYEVELHFLVDCVSYPIEVDIDWDYDGITWGNSGLTQSVGTYAYGPEISEIIKIDFNPGGGSEIYYIAVQITDASIPGQAAPYVWPVPIVIE